MLEFIQSYDDFLKKELGYSSKTVISYTTDLEQYNNYLTKSQIDFHNINKDQIRDFLKYLDNEKLTNKSIARKLSSIRGFYNFLVDVGELKNNIYEEIENPKIEKKLPNFLNYEEITTLLESIDTITDLGVRNRLLLELIYATSLRLSKASNLEIKNINFSDKSI